MTIITRTFVAAVLIAAGTAPATATDSSYTDFTICTRALNADQSGWMQDSFYTEEAGRRGLRLDWCRRLAAEAPAPTPRPTPTPAAGHDRIFAALICFDYPPPSTRSRCFHPDNGMRLFRSEADCERLVTASGRISIDEGGWRTMKCFKKTVPVWEPVR